ncbi:MAG: hypothetical protein MUF40_04370 [Gemmatimonadaceae bacterium]|nr:hypothetical protein [Gemmatimonadaceae bacterium]
MRRPIAALLLLLTATSTLSAQDRLRQMPGYEQYARMAPKLPGAIKSGAVTGRWTDDGTAFDYMRDGKRLRFELATRRIVDGPSVAAPAAGRRGAGVARGRQSAEAWTRDSSRKAVYRATRPRRCGGRRTAASSRSTGSTRSR